jgi:hypothetical protein
MQSSACIHPPCDRGDFYEIRIQDHLDMSWAIWFEGLSLAWTVRGETILSGVLPDQAALLGILNKLHRLNLSLNSITRIEAGG